MTEFIVLFLGLCYVLYSLEIIDEVNWLRYNVASIQTSLCVGLLQPWSLEGEIHIPEDLNLSRDIDDNLRLIIIFLARVSKTFNIILPSFQFANKNNNEKKTGKQSPKRIIWSVSSVETFRNHIVNS